MPKFVKGSPEALAWGAKMRASRKGGKKQIGGDGVLDTIHGALMRRRGYNPVNEPQILAGTPASREQSRKARKKAQPIVRYEDVRNPMQQGEGFADWWKKDNRKIHPESSGQFPINHPSVSQPIHPQPVYDYTQSPMHGKSTTGRSVGGDICDAKFSLNDLKNAGGDIKRLFGGDICDNKFSLNDIKNAGQDIKRFFGGDIAHHHHHHHHSSKAIEGGDIGGWFRDLGHRITDPNTYNPITDPFKRIADPSTYDPIVQPITGIVNQSVGSLKEVFGSQNQAKALKLGKQLASVLIHQGIPLTAQAICSAAADALCAGTLQPQLIPIANMLAGQAGKAAGKALADEVGRQTGYGLLLNKNIIKNPIKAKGKGKKRAVKGKKYNCENTPTLGQGDNY
jgi:hypothetical protein